MTREEYIKNAFEAYDKHEYDSALQSFIAAHELSDLEGKKYIVEALYASFVEPNLDEFRQAYDNNVEIFLKGNPNKKYDIPEFEDLRLTFYPASNTKYYIYVNDTNEFAGDYPIDLDAYADQEVEETTDAILFDSICDFRDIWPEISVKKYSYIYFVLNDSVAEKYFYSFMLVPHISEKLGDNLRMFDSPEEFINYLKRTGNPVPKTIRSEFGFDYEELFKTLKTE
ncbi:hypothetical protein [Butyrivibrio sp. WCD2001]|uniref:hypothetical protein n=1 Tax=Butyrivibrio sp. WCD2001 TaxID=1280681 RepID=UPI000401AFE6|nr:hypothetical protein [Butyrivibrio sp. WCD2001]